jgi:hypothetical protein
MGELMTVRSDACDLRAWIMKGNMAPSTISLGTHSESSLQVMRRLILHEDDTEDFSAITLS